MWAIFVYSLTKFISKPFENVMYFHWKCWDYGGSSILQLTRCTVSPTSWTMRDFCIIFLRKRTISKIQVFFLNCILYFQFLKFLNLLFLSLFLKIFYNISTQINISWSRNWMTINFASSRFNFLPWKWKCLSLHLNYKYRLRNW
jgi:hypothetical protein